MAKHLYSPDLSSIWGSIEQFLQIEKAENDEELPSFHKIVALLTDRDRSLEGALLGSLVVNSVSGSLGSVVPPASEQIGWLLNTGAVGPATADVNGYYQIVYNRPFPTDTAVAMFMSSVADPVNFLGLGPEVVQGTATKTGFTVAIGVLGDPVQGCYLAVGF